MNKGLYYQGPAPSTFFSGSFLRQRTIFEFTVGWPSASGTLIALKRSRRMMHACAPRSADLRKDFGEGCLARQDVAAEE